MDTNVNLPQKILETLESKQIERISLAFCDVDGLLRGKIVGRKKFLSHLEGAPVRLCDISFGWDCADTDYENNSFTGLYNGHPDLKAELDLNTFKILPWNPGSAICLLNILDRSNSAPLDICPRQLLRKIQGEIQRMDLWPHLAFEYEWTNVQLNTSGPTRYSPLSDKYSGLSIQEGEKNRLFFKDLFAWTKEMDISLYGVHLESGPGLYEASLEQASPLLAADQAIYLKLAIKQLALSHGQLASFMAKQNEQGPGQGAHIHLSLYSQDGRKNLFFDENSHQNMSPLLNCFLAGQIYCLPHLFPLLAPTINSYKRYVEEEFAPTNFSWGFDNRTAALRVITEGHRGTRLENRLPGSDVCPYLALSATLASGLYGIKNRLTLQDQPIQGNAYESSTGYKLPQSLEEATYQMQKSELAKELLGENFVNHYVETRIWECEQFARHVTDWERRRYFEII